MSSTATNPYQQDGFQIQQSAWEALMLNHLLLPALGAVFLLIVIFVIAFVFIKKKSGVGGACPEKSCHTIDSFHEASDISVYDVINECYAREEAVTDVATRIVCETKQDLHLPALKQRGVFSLTSCLGVRESFSSKTVILKSVTPLATPESKGDGPMPEPGRLSVEETCSHGNRTSTASSFQFDGRVYETLDRYWKAKRLNHVNVDVTHGTSENCAFNSHSFHSSDSDSQTQNNELGKIQNAALDHPYRGCLEDSVKSNLCDTASVPLSPNSGFTHKNTGANMLRTELKGCERENAFPKTTNGETICKLSFIPLAEAHSTRADRSRVRNFYYVIQNKVNTPLPIDNNDDYIAYPATHSVCLHFSSTSEESDNAFPHHGNDSKENSLNLKPLTNTDLIGFFEDAKSVEDSVKTTNFRAFTNQPQLSGGARMKQSTKSHPYKKRLLKKSESFSENGSHRPSESVRKLSVGAISFKQNARTSDGKQKEKIDKDEVARILSKLGPLPPIPRCSNNDDTMSQYLMTSGVAAVTPPKHIERPKGHKSGFTKDDAVGSNNISSGTCIDTCIVNSTDNTYCVSRESMTPTDYGTKSAMLCHSPPMVGKQINETNTIKSPNHYFILESGMNSSGHSYLNDSGSDGVLSGNNGNFGSEEDTVDNEY